MAVSLGAQPGHNSRHSIDIPDMYRYTRGLTENNFMQEYKTPKADNFYRSVSYGVPKGKTKYFTEQAEEDSKKTPGVGRYEMNSVWGKKMTISKSPRITQLVQIEK